MAKEETKKKAEEVVFGDDKPATAMETAGIQEETVSVNAKMFKDLLQRMNENEAKLQSMSKVNDESDIFNPLKDIATEHKINLSYYKDKLVLGFEGKERPDGTMLYVQNEMVEEGEYKGQVRGFVTLNYADGTKEKVDHVTFLRDLTRIPETIKSRKDIGRTVEQGEVTQMNWNGKTLVPTSTRIMTGYKEQKFIFVVDHKGKEYTVTQDVINL